VALASSQAGKGRAGAALHKDKEANTKILPMHHTAHSSSHTYTSPDLVKETYVVLFPIACFVFLCWQWQNSTGAM
jgi:hypothetical protein